jgi:hypothetical protein
MWRLPSSLYGRCVILNELRKRRRQETTFDYFWMVGDDDDDREQNPKIYQLESYEKIDDEPQSNTTVYFSVVKSNCMIVSYGEKYTRKHAISDHMQKHDT